MSNILKKLHINILNALNLSFLVIAIFLALKGNASTYYVSNAGNDSNTGTSPEYPWQTLEKVNGIVPKPGDSILFNRGDEWIGTITVNMWGLEDKPIVYGAYGEGDKPKIYGSEKITGWTKYSGNIYKASFNKKINQLFIDDERMRVARWPNKGYVFISSLVDAITLTTDDLDGQINYSGAKWFGRTNYFTTSLLEVESSDKKKIKLKSAPRFPLKQGLGFFLIDKLEFLDQAGEWYYDEKTNSVYFWTPKGDSPENYSIRGSVHDDGLYISGKDYVIIQDIHFLQQSVRGVHLRNSNYIEIDGNDFSYQDGFGIYCRTEATDYTITGNTIVGVNHYGMYLRISNSLISDNSLSRIALFENIGASGTGEDNFGGGIYLAGEKGNNMVRYNRLTDIGFSGILFARPENIIEYNFIKNVCLLKSDMGGIYTSWYKKLAPTGPEGSIIRNNIILNVVGEKNGFTSKRNMGEGIYIDEGAVGVLIENNTIAHCTNSGIKLHKTENIIVRNNTIYDARQSIHVLKSEGKEANKIIFNKMIAAFDYDDYLKRQVLINESSGNVLYDSNEYIHLYADKEIFFNGSSYYSFNKWKSSKPNEANSRAIALPLLHGEKEFLFYNDTRQEKIINLKGNFRDVNGTKIFGNIKLQPFTSLILIENSFK
jgi:parallel beta-helix repeat protein